MVGIWPDCSEGDDINAVDVDKERKYIITSDDFSAIKLFRYPAPYGSAEFQKYTGHSDEVTNIRFTSDNKHVISTGGNDKSVFQFKFVEDKTADMHSNEIDQYNDLSFEEDLSENYFIYDRYNELRGFEGFSSVDFNFFKVKPYTNDLIASSPKENVDKDTAKPPVQGIKKLKYVFGYNTKKCINNIFYTEHPGLIVYNTAALGIVLNIKDNTQRFFTNHKNEIISIDVHPNGHTVVTGEISDKGKKQMVNLFLWDINTLKNETDSMAKDRINLNYGVINLKGCILEKVSHLKFSPNGRFLAAIGGGFKKDQTIIVIYDTSNLSYIELISVIDIGRINVSGISWVDNKEFVTIGPKHIRFYKIKGRMVVVRNGYFSGERVKPLVSVASAFGQIFTGTSKGEIISWQRRMATRCLKIPTKAYATSLYYDDFNCLLLAGTSDGFIIAFNNPNLQPTSVFDIKSITQSPTDVGIRSIDCDEFGNLLIGTKGGEIYELSLKTQELKNKIMYSHCKGEVWAIGVNPKDKNIIVTGGGDKSLRVWDINKNKQLIYKDFPEEFRAIDWSSDGKFMVVGTMSGLVYYIPSDTFNVSKPFESFFFDKSSGNENWIQEIKISPNNKLVAFGSHSRKKNCLGKVQVLEIKGDMETPFLDSQLINSKVNSAITHLDWAIDNERLVINSLSFDLKYLSINSQEPILSSSCIWSDDLWYTWTCLFGYPVLGVYPKREDGNFINYTCLSNSKNIVATGDDDCLVKLFRAPCALDHCGCKAYSGHAANVAKVRFSADDRYLISTGGNDRCIFIWETDWGKKDDENAHSIGSFESERQRYKPKDLADFSKKYFEALKKNIPLVYDDLSGLDPLVISPSDSEIIGRLQISNEDLLRVFKRRDTTTNEEKYIKIFKTIDFFSQIDTTDEESMFQYNKFKKNSFKDYEFLRFIEGIENRSISKEENLIYFTKVFNLNQYQKGLIFKFLENDFNITQNYKLKDWRICLERLENLEKHTYYPYDKVSLKFEFFNECLDNNMPINYEEFYEINKDYIHYVFDYLNVNPAEIYEDLKKKPQLEREIIFLCTRIMKESSPMLMQFYKKLNEIYTNNFSHLTSFDFYDYVLECLIPSLKVLDRTSQDYRQLESFLNDFIKKIPYFVNVNYYEEKKLYFSMEAVKFFLLKENKIKQMKQVLIDILRMFLGNINYLLEAKNKDEENIYTDVVPLMRKQFDLMSLETKEFYPECEEKIGKILTAIGRGEEEELKKILEEVKEGPMKDKELIMIYLDVSKMFERDEEKRKKIEDTVKEFNETLKKK
ncbi:MAG: hypothetical protein MJ252_05860 [archaeon]|nr:hypothetical protein [archaeon]